MRIGLRFPLLCVTLLTGYAALKLDWARFVSTSPRDGCAFCDSAILEKQRFFEGREVLGILTHKPITPGHVLIIPKRHVERFEELTAVEMEEIRECIRKVDVAAQEMFGHKDYLLLQKNGKGAGQSVPHVHFHYLPAVPFLSVKFFIVPWLRPLSEGQLADLQKCFSEAVLNLKQG